MNFFNRKKEVTITTNPEIEKLKTEIKNETSYLAKLVSKYFNDPKNDWKFDRLSRPYLYLSGKVERVKDDNEYSHGVRGYNDNRHYIKDPTVAEMQETERRIKILQKKIRSLSLYETSKDPSIIDLELNQVHPINCDCDDCYNGEEEE